MPKFVPEAVSRRQVLQLTTTAALASVISACADAKGPSATQPTQPSPTVAPPQPVLPHISVVPTAQPAVVTSELGRMLCRDAWMARPPRPGGRRHTINRMTIHHTAVVLGSNSNSPGRLRQHQRYHMDEKGWIDIAYHVGVDRDGNIFELRSTEVAGDTATDYDTTGHFLVVCEGDFDQEPISEAQLQGAAVAFAWAAQRFNVLPSTLMSHREVTATTSCPGANLEAKVISGELRQRVSDILVGGPVSLPLVCGPEATETVARIEAGQ